ncbi:hydroxymethylbilane synthase [Sphingomonas sp. R-74633]|uniref:hydroxymethylbilane synthase n=1 Tax=Sphingomonas sp. R-74633 TaxID=2751188 RepID=UPI0015D1CFDF|nr:hydroxymethylbilane synthase [Sphingomonas sp. R-74633]NYT41597.1 hydroxymethylbilane synthase [Sphingomonas sp. R-74633]
MTVFKLGTRGSPLALVQANLVRDALAAANNLPASDFEIVVIRTTGDKVQDRALAEIGGKALWTKELDRALLGGEIDCAVHSMKDVETFRPEMIAIAAILPRADVRDRLVGAASIDAIPQGGVLGTSSPRRAAQVKRLRPDLSTVLFRGNVDTRLAKLAAGEADATLLAAAGLERLGRHDVGVEIPTNVLLPAPAQGAVGIEIRADDARARELVGGIDHAETHRCVLAERALLAALKADCHSPVAALARIEGAILTIEAELLSEDGAEHVHGMIEGAPLDPALPAALARDLLARAPQAVRRLFEG